MKKIVSLFMVLMLCIAVIPSIAFADNDEFAAGDINKDGIVNIFDLLTLRNYIVRGDLTHDQIALADLNLDGRVNVIDILFVRDIILGRNPVADRSVDILKGKQIHVAWSGGTFFSTTGFDPDGTLAARQAAINAIDARFGCEYVGREIPGGAFALLEAARPVIYAGDFFSDVMVSWVHRIGSGVELNLFKDLNKIPEMQMYSSKWDKNAVEQTRVFGKNLFVFPDFKSPANTAAGLMFNKRILGEVGMTSNQLYQMVRENKWTFSEFQSLSSKAYKDIDGVPGPSIDDVFGFTGVDMPGGVGRNVFIAASGVPVVRTNDGGFANNMESPQTLAALGVISSWLNKDRSVMTEAIDQRYWDLQTDAFMSGRALFYDSRSYTVPTDEFPSSDGWGMVPYPTSSAGEGYRSGINQNTEVIAIPANNTRDRTALAGVWLGQWVEGFSPIYAKNLANTKSRITGPDAAQIIEMNELIKQTGYFCPSYWGVINHYGNIIRLYRGEETDPLQSVKSVNFDIQISNFLDAVRAAG
ncbi:MAG: dockerin type I domain-containing protein [Oscillospiraceae bacterium]|nr:dockerin type I domain-containing protein [Oscillospiraceae bacterium]